jgi:hypothetical protein
VAFSNRLYQQGFGVVLLLAVLNLLVLHWRRAIGPAGLVLLVAMTFLAGGSKGSTLPVLVCGCLTATAAAALWRTGQVRRVAADSAMVIVTLVIIVKLIFGGADGGLEVDPFASIIDERGREFVGVTAGVTGVDKVSIVLLTLLAVMLGGIGAIGLLTDKVTRRDPAGWLFLGGGLSGVGAILVFDHPGLSQWYFQWTGEVMLAVAAAWGGLLIVRGVPQALRRVVLGGAIGVIAAIVARALYDRMTTDGSSLTKGWLTWIVFAAVVVLGSVLVGRSAGRRGVVAAALAAVTVAGVVPAVHATTSALPPDSTAADRATVGSFHSSQVEAARWIRDHSDPDDIVMTNRHCRGAEVPRCDVRRFFVAAYAERRVLVEGWAYTKTANSMTAESPLGNVRRAPFWDPALLELNDSFFTDPDAEKAAQLRDLGVRWVFVDDTAPHAETLEPYATERFRTSHATVYELVG